MFCANCGVERVQETNKFCINCGSKFQTPNSGSKRQNDSEGLLFNGIYQSHQITSPSSTSWQYLKFSSSGQVFAVTSTGNPIQVNKWIDKNDGISKGNYKLDREKQNISFSAISNFGQVNYQGKVGAKSLDLEIHSLINGNKSKREFIFVKVEAPQQPINHPSFNQRPINQRPINQEFRNHMDSSAQRMKKLLSDLTGDFFSHEAPSQELDEDRLGINKDPKKPKIRAVALQPSNYDIYTKFLLNFYNQMSKAFGQSSEKSKEQLENYLKELQNLIRNVENLNQIQLKALSLSLANISSMKEFTFDHGQIVLKATNGLFKYLEKGKFSYHGIALSYYFLLYNQHIPQIEHLNVIEILENIYFDKPIAFAQADIALQILNHYFVASYLGQEILEKVKQFSQKSRDGDVITFIQLNQLWFQFRQFNLQAKFGQIPNGGFFNSINNFNIVMGIILGAVKRFPEHDEIQQALRKVLDLMKNLATVDKNEKLLNELTVIRKQVKDN